MRPAFALVGLTLLFLAVLVLLAGTAAATSHTCTIGTPSGTTGSNGWYRSSVSVPLTAGSGATSIEWSLDNGTFTTYTGTPVSVSGEGYRWLRCRAFDSGGATQETTPRQIKIDGTPPSACYSLGVRDSNSPYNIVPAGNGSWHSPSGSGIYDLIFGLDAVSGVASSPSAYSGTRLDGSPTTVNDLVGAQNYGPTVLIFGEGPHTVDCYVTDRAGNLGGPFQHVLGIDRFAPSCSLSYPYGQNGNGWISGLGNMTATASDSTSTIWSVNYTIDGISRPYTAPFPLPRGSSFISCTARDSAGNSGTSPAQLYKFDDLPPEPCAIARVHDSYRGQDLNQVNGWYGSPNLLYGASVYLVSSDNLSGVEYYLSVQVDAQSWQQVSSTNSVTVYNEGTHTLSCIATDLAGNTVTTTLHLALDAAQPSCAGRHTGTVGAGGWYTTGVFQVTARDTMSGVWHANLTLGATQRNAPYDPTARLDAAVIEINDQGSYILRCLVTDAAGLTALSTFDVRLDTETPVCTGAFDGTPGNAGWHVRPGTFSINASAGRSGAPTMEYSLDNGAFKRYSAPFAVSDDGTHTVTCRVTAPSGARNTGTTTFKLDATPPNACTASARDRSGAFVEPRRGWYRSALDYRLVATDATSGIANMTVRLDGERITDTDPASVGTISFPIDGLGAHTVTCTASDVAGNALDRVEIDVRIDNVPPTCSAEPRGDAGLAGWFVGNASFLVGGDDVGSGIDTTTYSLDGGAERAGALVQVAGDGLHTLRCTARDLAGNAASETVDLRLDMTPPACALEVEGDAAGARSYKPPVKLKLNASDATSGMRELRYALNAAEVRAYAGPIDVADLGLHEVTCIASDQAGNTRNESLGRVRLFDDVEVARDPTTTLPGNDVKRSEPLRPTPMPAGLALVALAFLALIRRERA